MCEFRSQLGQHSPNWVPSNGSMAPCRSHHGNHTRQELDPSSDRLGTESRYAGVLGLAPCHNDRNIYIYRERERSIIRDVIDNIKQQR